MLLVRVFLIQVSTFKFYYKKEACTHTAIHVVLWRENKQSVDYSYRIYFRVLILTPIYMVIGFSCHFKIVTAIMKVIYFYRGYLLYLHTCILNKYLKTLWKKKLTLSAFVFITCCVSSTGHSSLGATSHRHEVLAIVQTFPFVILAVVVVQVV